jgi:hypothetical protein
MVFISGYENELYSQYLTEKKGWCKETYKTSTKGSKGDMHYRTEVVWMNKHYQKALATGVVPIKLTEKEQKQGKVNPIRD